MKKLIVFVSIVVTTLMLSACHSKKEEAPISSLNGEWNISEINGKALTAIDNRENPYIVFDTATGQMFGFSGCNRMMSTFDVNAQPGVLALEAVSSTRMACPDMTMEQLVLSALANVKTFKKEHDDKIDLCDAEHKTVMVLEKKKNDVTVEIGRAHV